MSFYQPRSLEDPKNHEGYLFDYKNFVQLRVFLASWQYYLTH
jgi:hypothetical protein